MVFFMLDENDRSLRSARLLADQVDAIDNVSAVMRGIFALTKTLLHVDHQNGGCYGFLSGFKAWRPLSEPSPDDATGLLF